MKQNQQIIEGDGSAPEPNEPVRKPVLIATGIIVLVCIGGVVFYKNREKNTNKAAVEAVGPAQTQESPAPRTSPAKVEEEPKAVETTGTAVETRPAPTPVAVPSA